jgi:hypothetical protein
MCWLRQQFTASDPGFVLLPASGVCLPDFLSSLPQFVFLVTDNMVALRSVLLLLALGTESLVTSQSVICQSKLGTKSIPASKVPRATTTIHNKLTVLKKVIRKVNVVVVPRPTTTTSTEVKTITETTQADPDVETAIEIKTGTNFSLGS